MRAGVAGFTDPPRTSPLMQELSRRTDSSTCVENPATIGRGRRGQSARARRHPLRGARQGPGHTTVPGAPLHGFRRISLGGRLRGRGRHGPGRPRGRQRRPLPPLEARARRPRCPLRRPRAGRAGSAAQAAAAAARTLLQAANCWGPRRRGGRGQSLGPPGTCGAARSAPRLGGRAPGMRPSATSRAAHSAWEDTTRDPPRPPPRKRDSPGGGAEAQE